jgi:hypothetical protein
MVLLVRGKCHSECKRMQRLSPRHSLVGIPAASARPLPAESIVSNRIPIAKFFIVRIP